MSPTPISTDAAILLLLAEQRQIIAQLQTEVARLQKLLEDHHPRG